MAALYSYSFIRAHGGAGGSYEVPAGYRAVIRCITAFCGSTLTPEAAQVTLGHSSCTIALLNFYAGLDSEGNNSQVWNGRCVVEALDTIIVSSGPDVDVTVSGYLLVDDGP